MMMSPSRPAFSPISLSRPRSTSLTNDHPTASPPNADFEIRDKRDEGKMCGLESSRVANVVVFGKARSIVGEENERPKDVLTAGPLVPRDKPRRPLKIDEVGLYKLNAVDP